MKGGRSMYGIIGLLALVIVVAVWQVAGAGAGGAADQPADAAGVPAANEVSADAVPAFEVDADWPQPLPNNWILGQVAGVFVDGRDHVWIVHRPASITEVEAGAAQDPPISTCCIPAPPVIEFGPEGNVVQAWGGPGEGYDWPASEHGIHVDGEGNVWLAGNGDGSAQVLKFTSDGELLLQIGEAGQSGGSNDTETLDQPAAIAVDLEANEVFVADGYGNRRIIVFDATSGEYKRHWGAYGERPDDSVELGDYDPDAPPARQFRGPVHGIQLTSDGLVYVADRRSNRIQVFQRSGEYVNEVLIAPNTLGMGSVWDIEASKDPAQTYLFVPDGMNHKVWILRREDMAIVGSFGRGGRYAGQFGWVHNLAVDSEGNIYTTEVETGKRVQKFESTGTVPPETT